MIVAMYNKGALPWIVMSAVLLVVSFWWLLPAAFHAFAREDVITAVVCFIACLLGLGLAVYAAMMVELLFRQGRD